MKLIKIQQKNYERQQNRNTPMNQKRNMEIGKKRLFVSNINKTISNDELRVKNFILIKINFKRKSLKELVL